MRRNRRRRRPVTPDEPGPADQGTGDDDELVAPPWLAPRLDAASRARFGAVLRALPGTVALAVRLGWRADRSALFAAAGLQLGSGVLAAFGLLATASVLTELLGGGPTGDRVLAAIPALALVVGALALRALLDAGVTAAGGRLTPRIRRIAEDDLIAACSQVELACFDSSDFHDAMVRARDQGVVRVEQAVRQIVTFIGSLISLAAAGAALGVLNPVLVPVLVLAALPTGWATLRAARERFTSMIRTMEVYRRQWILSDLLADRSSAAEVRAYTAQPFLIADVRRLAGRMEAEQVRLASHEARIQLVGRALGGVGTGLAYALLGWLLVAGITPLALAGTAVIAVQASQRALASVVLTANLIYEQSLYVAEYAEFLQLAQASARRHVERAAPRDPQRIALDGVSFGYPGAEALAVDGVSASIRRGEVVALVGENGSGKTTLAKLLAGLYLPDTGHVTWDGVDLAEVDADSVHDQVAVVTQEPTRWPFTARQNVVLGRSERPDPDGEHLADAALGSGADAVAAELSRGWDTLLSKQFRHGADLSGGQWQRISVARALYRDAPILIADEPTAALDARAEAAVYDTLRRLAAGRTVVLITHRLASVRHADQILLLDHGRLTERGTHAELMAAGGHYAELYNLQARAYVEELPEAGA